MSTAFLSEDINDRPYVAPRVSHCERLFRNLGGLKYLENSPNEMAGDLSIA